MSGVVPLLAQYARYHRDRRNVLTHFVGIPVIVISVACLVSRPLVSVGPVALTPAWVVLPLWAHAYLRLDDRLGVAMAFALAVAGFIGARVAALPTVVWAAITVVAFVGGWLVQFVGHVFEGRRPAFLDDLRGLLIGPLFLAAEAAFALGLRAELRSAVLAERDRATP